MSTDSFTISSVAIVVATATLLIGCSSPVTSYKTSSQAKDIAFNGIKVTLFQLPTCACCESYKDYLREHGFQVETTYVEDLSSIEEQYQIPQSMRSCHTAVIAGYFVEGHVPVKAINKLIEEEPGIDGIALPGMPPGSPGMPGQNAEALKIYALSDGTISEFITLNEQ